MPQSIEPQCFAPPPILLQELVNAAPLAISITDPKAHILYVNPAFTRITGYSADEVLGKNSSLLSYQVTPPEVYQQLWQNISHGQPWNGRLVNRRKDGSRYIAELAVSPILDDYSEVRFFLGIHSDVTEIYELTERLQNQKRLTETMIDLAPVAVVLLDEKNEVVLDNHEYRKLMGQFGQEEPVKALLTALQDDLGEASWSAACAAQSFDEHILRFDQAGGVGPKWYAISGQWFVQNTASADGYFTTSSQQYLLLVVTDVSQLKQQQQQQWLTALRAMLSEGELVSRLRETLSAAAYKLAEPVNLIAAAEKRAAGRIPAGDPLLVALHEARQQGEMALQTLQAAMPAHAPEAWRPLNINEILQDVLMLSTEKMLAAGVIVDWQPAMRLPSISGQATALRGALTQLINNAVDAMQEARSRHRELQLSTQENGEWIEVRITDTGPGIPEHLRLRVFEPFFTTRPGGARAGMGLTLAQETIQRHEGCLEIGASIHDGCQIIVRIPTLPVTHSDMSKEEQHG